MTPEEQRLDDLIGDLRDSIRAEEAVLAHFESKVVEAEYLVKLSRKRLTKLRTRLEQEEGK